MTIMDADRALSPTALRDGMAVAIARAVVSGRSIPDDLLEDFARIDAEAGLSWH